MLFDAYIVNANVDHSVGIFVRSRARPRPVFAGRLTFPHDTLPSPRQARFGVAGLDRLRVAGAHCPGSYPFGCKMVLSPSRNRFLIDPGFNGRPLPV